MLLNEKPPVQEPQNIQTPVKADEVHINETPPATEAANKDPSPDAKVAARRQRGTRNNANALDDKDTPGAI